MPLADGNIVSSLLSELRISLRYVARIFIGSSIAIGEE
jgi:hypothetical protein